MRQDDFIGPVNIGSEEMVEINQLAKLVIITSGKNISLKNIDGEEFKSKYGFKCPVGVKGRNSDNKLYREKMNWEPQILLSEGIIKTFDWINEKVQEKNKNVKWIFESPDNGRTINRRVINL
jgi:nucleoside-diphosphate-sugar epimerase